MLTELNPERITDNEVRQAVVLLMNLVEKVQQENARLREENQALRDENNRLKGEQGKPQIKAGRKQKANDHSSEKERRIPRERRKREKRPHLKIDREQVVKADKGQLPADAVFKGYEDLVVQDLQIKREVLLIRREKYYSPVEKKTYTAPLPPGYEGAFGPGVRAMILSLYHVGGMTEPKIKELLDEHGVEISSGKISMLLTKDMALWEEEGAALYRAGLASSLWQHTDDTSTRVNGENHHCHVVGNPYYSWYDTRERKDRLTVIAVLQQKERPDFLYDERTEDWLQLLDTPQWARDVVKTWPQAVLLSQEDVALLVASTLAERLNAQQQARVMEAGALTAYYAQQEMPVVPILVSDDAAQFAKITKIQALCWVHEGRHYKKLTPLLAYHQQLLAAFHEDFWQYYRQLLAFKKAPSEPEKERLELAFDVLFGRETGYEELDKRIAKTRRRKEKLLVALTYPEVPLHNNLAELAVRQRVRKRDISFGPRTSEGKKAWDLFASLSETSKKLGVSFYQYVFDRVSGAYQMPSLATLIQELAEQTLPP